MFLYQRLNEILYALKQQSFHIPVQELSQMFHISDRTLRSDIQNINSILKNHGASISLKRKAGYFLDIDDNELFQKFQLAEEKNTIQGDEFDSSDKRIRYILQALLYESDYTTQEDLAELVYVSKNTISNYMKTIRIILNDYHLSLKTKANLGCKIYGNEEDKRACIMDKVIPHVSQSNFIGFSTEEERVFEGIDLKEMESIVLDFAKEYDFHFSDFNLKNIILHFALLISRMEIESPITNYSVPSNEDISRKLHPLIKRIESTYHIAIPETECNYIYSHFIANTTSQLDTGETQVYIQKLIDQLLNNIFQNYHFDLHKDEYLTQDLKHHFQAILNTKFYQLNKRNPLLNTIKLNYPLAFEITLTAIRQVFEKEPYTLTDDEIGYVSLHIGAAIERCFSAKIQKKSVIIVCGSGFATSRMLQAKLNNIFNDKINISGNYSYNEYLSMDLQNIDFVISTIPIKTKDVPVVIVDFSLLNKDIENISKTLACATTSSDQKIDKFFDHSLFIKKSCYTEKNALLHDLSNLLIKNEIVPVTFEQTVLARENIATTRMNEILAIPHPMELCAKETKVAVAILEKPILWNNQESVRIILLLAIKKDEHQDIEHLYDTFIQIMNDTKIQQLLLKCKNFEEFLHILHLPSEI